ncbi:hypothetical protein FRC00_002145, partial [Tulasnella sp. 408]
MDQPSPIRDRPHRPTSPSTPGRNAKAMNVGGRAKDLISTGRDSEITAQESSDPAPNKPQDSPDTNNDSSSSKTEGAGEVRPVQARRDTSFEERERSRTVEEGSLREDDEESAKLLRAKPAVTLRGRAPTTHDKPPDAIGFDNTAPSDEDFSGESDELVEFMRREYAELKELYGTEVARSSTLDEALQKATKRLLDKNDELEIKNKLLSEDRAITNLWSSPDFRKWFKGISKVCSLSQAEVAKYIVRKSCDGCRELRATAFPPFVAKYCSTCIGV